MSSLDLILLVPLGIAISAIFYFIWIVIQTELRHRKVKNATIREIEPDEVRRVLGMEYGVSPDQIRFSTDKEGFLGVKIMTPGFIEDEF